MTAGVDVRAAKARGDLTVVDAEDTLFRFMIGGLSGGAPDPEAFRSVVGGLIARASAEGRYPRVRAYGEMVDVLFRQGNEDATARVEELWNELAQTHSFELCCAYLLSGFDHARHRKPFQAICRLHSQVFPAESYHELGSPEEHRRQIAELQQRARALEREIAERERAESERDRLLASERAARAGSHRAQRDGPDADRVGRPGHLADHFRQAPPEPAAGGSPGRVDRGPGDGPARGAGQEHRHASVLRFRRAAHLGGPGSAPAGRLEPALECGEVHPCRRPGRRRADTPGLVRGDHGHGHRARLSLPIMPVTADPLRVLPTAQPRKAPRLDGVTILVVDDHDDGRIHVSKPVRAEQLAEAVAAVIGRIGTLG